MLRVSIYIVLGIILVVCAGCSADAPTDTSGVSDDGIAKLVAGVAGFESTGLAAMVTDLVMVGSGGTLRQSVPAFPSSSSVVVTRIDSSFDPESRVQSLALACERNGSDTRSEWDMHYSVQFAEPGERVAGQRIMQPVGAQTRVEGIYRGAAMTTRGESNGEVSFGRMFADRSAELAGTYRWAGSIVLRGAREERFDDVVVTCTWKSLDVSADQGREQMKGRCDVVVHASGPDGIVACNGALQFDGSERAVFSLGSRRFLLNVRTGECERAL